MTIRLYDLELADGQRMSPYCSRVKMALALKRIPYETVPVGFTEIPAILGGGVTTIVPLIEDGDRRIADSFAIAEHLEERHPGPALFLPGTAGRMAARFVEAYCFTVVHAQAMPLVALTIHQRLKETDKAYFRESREKRLGHSLEEAFADHETRPAGLPQGVRPAAPDAAARALPRRRQTRSLRGRHRLRHGHVADPRVRFRLVRRRRDPGRLVCPLPGDRRPDGSLTVRRRAGSPLSGR